MWPFLLRAQSSQASVNTMALGPHDKIPTALDKAVTWQSSHLWDSWLSKNVSDSPTSPFYPSPKV